MPLASTLALQWYGPGCGAAVGVAEATAPSAVLKGLGRLDAADTTSPTAYARISDGRRLAAVDTTAPTASATLKGRGRMAAVGTIGELSQDDVTGAVLEARVEGTVTVKEALRLLLAVAAGDATGLNANPAFRSLDGSKTRIGGTLSGGSRTITTRDGT